MPKTTHPSRRNPDKPTDDPARRKPCPRSASLGRALEMKTSPGVFTHTGHDVGLIYVSYPEKLLAVADDLVKKGEFSIAVVVAHIACEMSVQRALSRACRARKDIHFLEQFMKELRIGYNLAKKPVRDLYNGVTGNQIQKQRFWGEFALSATRRNEAVHEGKIVTKAQAEASFNAASALVAYLK